MVRFSYSAIKLLRTDPAEYRRIYIQGGPKPKETEYMIEGSLLHDIILSPHIVGDKYISIPKKPTSEMMLAFIERKAFLIDTHLSLADGISREDVERCVAQAYESSGYSESIESVLKKSEEFNDYFKYCLQRNSKLPVLPGQKEKVEELISAKLLGFLAHPPSERNDEPVFFKDLLQAKRECKGVVTEVLEHYWEFPFEIEYSLNSKTTGNRKTVELIGSFDYITVNHKAKVISIKDLKKVENLLEFPSTYKEKHLDLQAGTYLNVIERFLRNLGIEDYKIEFYFPVVDKERRCFEFKLSEETKKKCQALAVDDLDKAFWHLNTKTYDLPYEYYHSLLL